MSNEDINRSFEILGLKPDADVEEIKQAYRDLMTVWQPDKYADNSRLREQADEKITEIVGAYNTILAHKKEHESRQAQPDEQIEKVTTVIDSDDAHESIEPERQPDKSSFESSGEVKTGAVSDKAVKFFLMTCGFGVGQRLTALIKFSNPTETFFITTIIVSLCGLACWFIGRWLMRIINEKDSPKQAKIKLAWIACILGFVISLLIIVALNIVKSEIKSKEYSNCLDSIDIVKHNKNIESNPNDVKAYYCRGVVYYFIGIAQSQTIAYDRAITDFNKAIELNPKYAAAYADRGQAYRELGNYNQALADSNKAIELDQKNPFFHLYRGNTYDGLGNYDQAIVDFNKAIEINPKYVGAYHSRGEVYLKLGNYNQAIVDFNKAIEINSIFFPLYSSRGKAYHELGNYNQAIADYSKVIELDPKYAGAYFNRGLVHLKAGNTNKGIEDMKIAARLDHKDAQNALRAVGIEW